MSPVRRVRIDDGPSQSAVVDESERLQDGEAILSQEEYEARRQIEDNGDQCFTDADFAGHGGRNDDEEDGFIQTPEQAYGLEPDDE